MAVRPPSLEHANDFAAPSGSSGRDIVWDLDLLL